MEPEDPSKSMACERCYRRKARCDKGRPFCSSCVKARTTCVYSFREPAARRQEVERLERRLRQMEAKNEALSSQLLEAQRRASVGGTLSAGQDVDARTVDVNRDGRVESHHSSNNEVASQVSCFSLNVAGGQQFLGSASGVLLGNLLQMDAPSTAHLSREDELYTPSRPFRFGNGLTSGATTSKAATLPPERLARSLLSAYLSHDHLCYPFILPRSLTAAIDAIYADDSFYASHPVEAFSTDMVLAIGTAQVYKFDWQVLPDAETHYDRAISRLPTVLDRGGICALQAILFICQYRMLSATYDTSASLWHLIGMAARIAFELGLHNESIYASPKDVSSPNIAESKELSEIKKRCFWCVFAMDRIASITLGRPLAISMDDVDTELPQVVTNTVTGPDGTVLQKESPDCLESTSETAIFVHIIRYRAICGKILTTLHNTVWRKTHIDYSTVREQLAQELDDWNRDNDSLALVDAASPVDQNGSSFRSRDWYILLYQNGILVLYRPSSTLQDLPQNREILQRIFDAARQSIGIYGYLHRTRKINYSWITLHAVFIAGLSYVYAVRLHFQTRRRHLKLSMNYFQGEHAARLMTDPPISQIANDTRACLTVLVAVSERWSTARNCHTVFGRLCDASLADVVEFYTQPAQARSDHTPNTSVSHEYSDWNHSSAAFSSMQRQSNLLAANGDTNSYQDCFADLHRIWDENFGNETLMQASHDWLSEIQALNDTF